MTQDMVDRQDTVDRQALAGGEALVGSDEWVDLPPSYLYTGAQSPALKAVADAVAEAMVWQSRGEDGRTHYWEVERAGQRAVAAATGCGVDDVAFVGDASTAWNSVANGLRWEPGDNVVVNDLEHPSVFYPFLRLRAHGLEVRMASHVPHRPIGIDDLEPHVDRRTRAIAVSHVDYVTGARQDVAAISELADAKGTPLIVDWSHSLGVLPVDASLCGIGISASYKWTLGPYGAGVVVWNRDRLPDFVPGGIGWRSVDTFYTDDRFDRARLSETAGRFRLGAPPFAVIAGLTAGLDRIAQCPPNAVAAHSVTLASLAATGLEAAGHVVLTPRDDDAHAGSVSFAHPEGEALAAALARRGVLAWGGDGRVRASFHVMNHRGDVTALLDALAEAIRDR